MRKYIFWGATGQAIVLDELLQHTNDRLSALFDNNRELSSPLKGISLYYGMEGLKQWIENNNYPSDYHFAVAIGGDGGKARIEIHEALTKLGFKTASLVHPTAFIAKNAALSESCQILPNATVCAMAKLGRQVIVNTAASVDHECILHEGVHVGPGVKMGGLVTIGQGTFVGTGATILPRINIGVNVTVGAGAVVTKDVPDNTVIVGVPAKIIRTKQ